MTMRVGQDSGQITRDAGLVRAYYDNEKRRTNREGSVAVVRERFFNRVVKTNLFQLGVWGRCKAPAGSGAEPRRQADFDNNLLKIN